MDYRKYEQETERCIRQLKHVRQEMPNPPAEYSACADGYYFRKEPFLPFSHIGTWMTSFYLGEGLLAWHKEKDPVWTEWAESFREAYWSKLKKTPMDTMHDLGFLYTLYAVGLYRETGKAEYRDMAVEAAALLARRADAQTGFIRAWGRLDVQDHHSAGLAIIDCMMNLPLLYFAWQETGNREFYETAVRHADQTRRWFIRPDGSVCHGWQYREAGGIPVGEANHCGYAVGSFWARGLAWAIYGFALSWQYTGNRDYLETSRQLAERFLKETQRQSRDVVPPWDFRLPDCEEKRKDSSAAAITACALDELYMETGETHYRLEGERILACLMSPAYRNADTESYGLLLHSNGKEHCTSFGDYFYLEALLRYQEKEFRGYW